MESIIEDCSETDISDNNTKRHNIQNKYFILLLSQTRKEKRINDSSSGLDLPFRISGLGGKLTLLNLMKPTLFSVLLGHVKRKSKQVRNCLLSYHIFIKVHEAFAQSDAAPLEIHTYKICRPFGTHECVIHVCEAL